MIRPWWQRPLVRLYNWWTYGCTEAKFGERSIPRHGPPRTSDGNIVGAPLYGQTDGLCSEPTTGSAGVVEDPIGTARRRAADVPVRRRHLITRGIGGGPQWRF